MPLPRLFVIGDSISIQYGPFLEKYVAGLFTYSRRGGEVEALRNLDIPTGANGGDSSMVLNYLRTVQKAGGLPADLLLLNCGLHDIKTTPATGAKQIPIDQYRKNISDIVQVVKEMGIKLIWMRSTPCDENVHNHRVDFHRFSADAQAYNAAANEIMSNAGVPIVDLYTFTLNLGPDLYCDHAHYHEPIREKQAAFLAGAAQALWTAGLNR